jgi:arsenical pump membrane protein
MMLLSELARQEGLFDWLAALATTLAKGSPTRLFTLIYAVGTLVTIFLSNDATAVVLTPAVYAATRAARVSEPLPYLLICAFIANAASFVLPISNPANLVVFGGGHMPPLATWLGIFALPSLLAILATYAVLRFTQRQTLRRETVATDVARPALTGYGKLAAGGILATAIVLLAASAFGIDLGLPTLLAGLATAALVLGLKRANPVTVLQDISWGVLPLVAGLFILVEALDRTGVTRHLADMLHEASAASPREAAAGAGLLVAFGANLVNNLPAGLVAGSAVQLADVSHPVASAILIGIDLGPNLSVTGSLATILWLTALRREGQHVGAWAFLKLGLAVMPPALVLAVGAVLLRG